MIEIPEEQAYRVHEFQPIQAVRAYAVYVDYDGYRQDGPILAKFATQELANQAADILNQLTKMIEPSLKIGDQILSGFNDILSMDDDDGVFKVFETFGLPITVNSDLISWFVEQSEYSL